MKSIIYTVCIFGMLLCFTSCKKHSESEIRKMISSKVNLDMESLEMIEGILQTEPFLLKDYKFIVYADSGECMTCAIQEMHKWNLFSDSLERDYDISFMYILSPKKNEYENLKSDVLRKKLAYSVFIDSSNQFAKMNKNILSKSIYHVFILDNNNNIIYVGDPRINDKLFNILWRSIETVKKKYSFNEATEKVLQFQFES